MRPLLPVLMTASVDTRGMKGALFAASEREKMYVETVRYYLDAICRDPRQKIVFCDNSGWDLASLREKVCADIFTGNSLSDAEKRAFAHADGLPFIGMKDVGFDLRLDYENGIRAGGAAALAGMRRVIARRASYGNWLRNVRADTADGSCSAKQSTSS